MRRFAVRAIFGAVVAFGFANVLAARAFVGSGQQQPPPPPPATQLETPGSRVSAPPLPAALTCANPRLPAAILDGVASRPQESPLPVVELKAPGATLHLAIASDTTTRDYGLMCVTRLRTDSGMLFVFVRNDVVEFWMKHTLIPLDMLWLSPGGRVTAIAPNVPAAALETSDDDVARRRARGRYVIELARGEANRAKIAVGTLLPIAGLKLPPASE